MQLRRLAALERQKIIDELARLQTVIEDLEAILASPERQRQIISDELTEIVDKFGDERRTRILPFDGDMNVEDLIQEEEVVVTITRGGYAKRTRSDAYRAQRRGGKGVRGAQLRSDDVVEHFFVTSTHNWVALLHQPRPGLPGEGVRAAGGRSGRQGPARGQPARLPARRGDRAGRLPADLRGRAVSWCWPPGTVW